MPLQHWFMHVVMFYSYFTTNKTTIKLFIHKDNKTRKQNCGVSLKLKLTIKMQGNMGLCTSKENIEERKLSFFPKIFEFSSNFYVLPMST